MTAPLLPLLHRTPSIEYKRIQIGKSPSSALPGAIHTQLIYLYGQKVWPVRLRFHTCTGTTFCPYSYRSIFKEKQIQFPTSLPVIFLAEKSYTLTILQGVGNIYVLVHTPLPTHICLNLYFVILCPSDQIRKTGVFSMGQMGVASRPFTMPPPPNPQLSKAHSTDRSSQHSASLLYPLYPLAPEIGQRNINTFLPSPPFFLIIFFHQHNFLDPVSFLRLYCFCLKKSPRRGEAGMESGY